MRGLVGDTQVDGRDPAGSQREAEPTWVGVIAAGAPTAVGWERSGGDGCVGAQVRTAVSSEPLPCAHPASGSQRVRPAPARPRGSRPPPQRPLTSRDLGESPSVSSLPPGVLERRRCGARGPSALASLSPVLACQVPNPLRSSNPCGVCDLLLFPPWPPQSHLSTPVSTLTPWAWQRRLEPPGRVQGEGAAAPAPQGGTGMVGGARHGNQQLWGPRGA